jgi:CarD family transcriptional regulator
MEETTVFSVNDTVMYGNSGVCKIMDIRPEKFGRDTVTYYVLKPVYDRSSTIYCPVGSGKMKMRKLLSIDEIYELIKIMPDMETEWVENEQLRKEKFNEIVRQGNHEELIRLIKTLHFKRQERLEAGKKFYIADEKIMKEAEKILHGEFAHVLNIQPEEVVPFIMGELDNPEKGGSAC